MLRLSISGISNCRYKRASHYTSIAKIPNSMVEYLVNSIGFSKEEALIASSKVSTFKSTVNPNSVIDFFKICGLSQTQIKNLVCKEPRILFSNVDKTLKPKIQAFQDWGFSESETAHIISVNPDICGRSLNNHIIPAFEMLKSVFGDDNEVLISAVKKSAWLLGPSAKKGLPGVISLLESYGLSNAQIKLFALRQTRYLSLGTKSLEPILIRVENLGIPRGSGMFIHGICALASSTEANLNGKMGIYKSYGFTNEDVLTLARKNPYTLKISESKLRNGLDFFMKEAGYRPSEITMVPNVVTFSLEKRVIPRYRVWIGLRDMGLLNDVEKRLKNDPFLSSLIQSEPRFFKKFVQPFEDRCPDLYHDYMKKMGSVLEVKATK